MAAIYLIRHGQASFDAANYDQLSDVGYRQAEILGAYWRQLPLPTPNQIIRGDMLRHRQTMESFFDNEQPCEIESRIDVGFNEFNHVEVLKQHRENWSELNSFEDFEREFTAAFKRWQSGEYDDHYQESWAQFQKRCIAALHRLMEQAGSTKNNIVFTSGGVISVILQYILELPDQQTMRLNQQIRNASLTRLLFSESRLSVDYINNFSHLEMAGPEWVTYR